MINIRLELEVESRAYLDSLPKKLEKGSAQAILWAMNFIETAARERFIQGRNADNIPPDPLPLPPPGPLVSRTRRLENSVQATVRKNVGWLDSDVPYAVEHELLGVGRNKGKRPLISPVFEGEYLEETADIIRNEVAKEMCK